MKMRNNSIWKIMTLSTIVIVLLLLLLTRTYTYEYEENYKAKNMSVTPEYTLIENDKYVALVGEDMSMTNYNTLVDKLTHAKADELIQNKSSYSLHRNGNVLYKNTLYTYNVEKTFESKLFGKGKMVNTEVDPITIDDYVVFIDNHGEVKKYDHLKQIKKLIIMKN